MLINATLGCGVVMRLSVLACDVTFISVSPWCYDVLIKVSMQCCDVFINVSLWCYDGVFSLSFSPIVVWCYDVFIIVLACGVVMCL